MRIVKALTYIEFCFILFFTISCEDDKITNTPESECLDLENEWNCITGDCYITDSIMYEKPCINPNDPNEIIYVEAKQGGIQKLVKYNLITKERLYLYEGVILYQPDWGRNDWILFNSIDYNIWKIKSNGDSLTQLTFDENNYYGEWNYMANIFIYQSFDEGVYNNIVSDQNGQALDTLDTVTFSPVGCWNHLEYLVDIGDNGIFTYNLTNFDSVISQLLINTNWVNITGMSWINESEILWFKFDPILNISFTYKTSNQSPQINKLNENCNIYYLSPSFSFISEKVIVNKIEMILSDDLSNIIIESSIVMLNASGEEEQIIL